MNPRTIIWMAGAGVALCGSSAACRLVYGPPAATAPLLGHQNELQVGASFGHNGMGIQGAWAPIEHVGVVASASYDPHVKENDATDHSHLYGEVGGGGWLKIADILRLELLGGIGGGQSTGQNKIGSGADEIKFKARGHYLRPFVQGDVGLGTQIVDLGLSLRVAYLQYWYDRWDGQQSDRSLGALFLEPAAFVRVGWKWVKAEAQCGIAWPAQEARALPEWLPFYFGLGLRGYIPLGEGE